jgi:dihydroorotase
MLTRRSLLASAGLLVWRAPRAAAARFELLIKNGRVIDPARNIDRVADVAIAAGRISAVQPGIPSADAADVLDARGKIVTPGLVDLHVHVASSELTPGALLGDGVTSMVDGGSAGADNIDALVDVARSAPNRVRIFLNLARTGVTGPGELLNIEAADVEAGRAAMMRHRDWIVGVKARLSESVAGDHDLEAVRRARRLAGPLPVMLHVGQTYSPLPKILELLQPGDIVTHIYSPPPHSLLDANGHVLAEIRAAGARGIRFDVGNGRTAHITWPVVEAATRMASGPTPSRPTSPDPVGRSGCSICRPSCRSS